MKRTLFLLLLIALSFSTILQAQDCDPDTRPPIPICINGLAVELMPLNSPGDVNNDGIIDTMSVEVFALDLLVFESISDNCPGVLSYRMAPAEGTSNETPPETESIVLTETHIGFNLVRAWVGDEAGNWDFCETYIIVGQNVSCDNDNVPPRALCKSTIDVSLDAVANEVSVSAKTLDEGSTDNCSNELIFGISIGAEGDNPQQSLTFTEIGTHLVSLSAFDESNNKDICQVYINVFDPEGNGPDCSNDSLSPIALCSEDQVFLVTTISNPFVLSAGLMGAQSHDNCGEVNLRIEKGGPGAELPNTELLSFSETQLGVQLVTVWAVDNAGNTSHCTVDIKVSDDFTTHLFSGSVFIDEGDCEIGSAQEAIENISVKVQVKKNGAAQLSQVIETEGALDPRYTIWVKEYSPTRLGFGGETMDYKESDQIDVEISLWENINTTCQNAYLIENITGGNNDSFHSNDIGIAVDSPCPELYIDLATPFLRRCFDTYYWVNYCNYGGADAKDAKVEVTFDDYIEILETGIPPDEVNGQTYRFSVGDLKSGQCGRFAVRVMVSCDAELGQTHCTEANISHTSNCNSSSFQGPELELKADCDGENVKFKIRNIGNNMNEGHHYIVIEDILMMEGGTTLSLMNGEEQSLSLPANGSTFRLEVDQAEGYPWAKTAGISLEGCGENSTGGFSTGFVTQFGEADWRPDVSIDCQVNIGSFDPNDKQAFPNGVGEDKLTKANTGLEYMIRFQNTGTDTAFNVVIEDQLSELLDITTVKPGASSHPYSFEIGGDRLMKFKFNDILLPDSIVNEPASHGFVKFSVQQVADNPNGSLITNNAAIYFDFNEPVITNTVTHLIGENVVSDNKELQKDWISIQVIPNPFNESTVLRIENAPEPTLNVQIFNQMGRLVRTEAMKAGQLILHRKELPNGMYYYTISGKSGVLSGGKLILN